MVQHIGLPVLSGEVELALPADWRLEIVQVREAPKLTDSETAAALDSPIGAPPLETLARGKKSAMVVVEDCMRSTPVNRLLPVVVDRLLAGGLREDRIRLILATGMHRAQNGADVMAKLGREIVERFEVLPHNPYENLVFLGEPARGIPVWVNRWVAESDLKIGVGGVVPHSGAGFGGGAKVVMPGVCGIETVAAHHEGVPRGGPTLDENAWRAEIETIARMTGLDWVINAVINGRAEAAGVFVGDMVAAHRKAAAFADSLYRVSLPRDMDIALVSGYPMDQEIAQARKAVRTAASCVRPGGSIVLFGDCPEGAGFHALYGAGGRFQEITRAGLANGLGDKQVWVCSSGVSTYDVRQYLPLSTILVNDSQALITRLTQQYPRARACVLKQGTLLIG
jgi:nickel-dependent lactate racemase